MRDGAQDTINQAGQQIIRRHLNVQPTLTVRLGGPLRVLVGVEILHQHPDSIEALFVPIGGGGLAAGIASYIKFLRPETRMIGVEPTDAASMKAALSADQRVVLDRVGLFADGVAVRQVGEETFRLCRQLLDEIVVADTDAICAGIKDIFEDVRILAEPAGALSLAGLKAYAQANPRRSGSLVAISSGANMNFDRLRHVAERAEVGEAREILLAVTIPEQAGSYRRFVRVLGNRVIPKATVPVSRCASCRSAIRTRMKRTILPIGCSCGDRLVMPRGGPSPARCSRCGKWCHGC